MNEPKNLQSKCNLLRVAVWGQGLGMLISGAFLMVEEAPEIFLRFSPWRVLLIVVCLIVISMRKPSTYLARGLPVWLLASLVLIVSLSSKTFNVSCARPPGLVAGFPGVDCISLIHTSILS